MEKIKRYTTGFLSPFIEMCRSEDVTELENKLAEVEKELEQIKNFQRRQYESITRTLGIKAPCDRESVKNE